MSLGRHFRTAPHRWLSALSFAVQACTPRRHAPALDATGLTDGLLSDIGVSRCLLLAGLDDDALLEPVG